MNVRISFKNAAIQKIDDSKGIDTTKASVSKECMFCDY